MTQTDTALTWVQDYKLPDGFNLQADSGVYVATRDDVILAQARATWHDGNEPQTLTSDVFTLRPDGDPANPGWQGVAETTQRTNERAGQTAIARHSMKSNERSPQDLVDMCTELARRAIVLQNAREREIVQERIEREAHNHTMLLLSALQDRFMSDEHREILRHLTNLGG